MTAEDLAAVIAERDRLRSELEVAVAGREAFARALARMVLLYLSVCEIPGPGVRGNLAAALVRWSLEGLQPEPSGGRTE